MGRVLLTNKLQFVTKFLIKKLLLSAPILLLVGIFSGSLFSQIQEDFKKGEIIGKVICRDKLEQSYALFLPEDYTPAKNRFAPWHESK